MIIKARQNALIAIFMAMAFTALHSAAAFGKTLAQPTFHIEDDVYYTHYADADRPHVTVRGHMDIPPGLPVSRSAMRNYRAQLLLALRQRAAEAIGNDLSLVEGIERDNNGMLEHEYTMSIARVVRVVRYKSRGEQRLAGGGRRINGIAIFEVDPGPIEQVLSLRKELSRIKRERNYLDKAMRKRLRKLEDKMADIEHGVGAGADLSNVEIRSIRLEIDRLRARVENKGLQKVYKGDPTSLVYGQAGEKASRLPKTRPGVLPSRGFRQRWVSFWEDEIGGGEIDVDTMNYDHEFIFRFKGAVNKFRNFMDREFGRKARIDDEDYQVGAGVYNEILHGVACYRIAPGDSLDAESKATIILSGMHTPVFKGGPTRPGHPEEIMFPYAFSQPMITFDTRAHKSEIILGRREAHMPEKQWQSDHYRGEGIWRDNLDDARAIATLEFGGRKTGGTVKVCLIGKVDPKKPGDLLFTKTHDVFDTIFTPGPDAELHKSDSIAAEVEIGRPFAEIRYSNY